MRLRLGVDDLPYVAPPSVDKATRKAVARKDAKPRKKKGKLAAVKRMFGLKAGDLGVITTGEVAAILEAKYGVMGYFVELHGQFIADEMAKSAAGAFETASMGGVVRDPFASAKAAIETRFRQFLSLREMDGKAPGVPTEAAQKGVSHRRKRPYRSANPERPSFIDTGLYQATMRASFEE